MQERHSPQWAADTISGEWLEAHTEQIRQRSQIAPSSLKCLQAYLGWLWLCFGVALVLLTWLGLSLYLAQRPQIDGQWRAMPGGAHALQSTSVPEMQAFVGQSLLAISGEQSGYESLVQWPDPKDMSGSGIRALSLAMAPRWIVDPAQRQAVLSRQESMQWMLEQSHLKLHFETGSVDVQPRKPGLQGLSWSYWISSGIASAIMLFAFVMQASSPNWANRTYLIMVLGVWGQLLLWSTQLEPLMSLSWPPESLMACSIFMDAMTLGGLMIWAMRSSPPLRLFKGRPWDVRQPVCGLGLLLILAWATTAWFPDHEWSGMVWWLGPLCIMSAIGALLSWTAYKTRQRQDWLHVMAIGLATFSWTVLSLVCLHSGEQSGLLLTWVDQPQSIHTLWYATLAAVLLALPLFNDNANLSQEFVSVALFLSILFLADATLLGYAGVPLESVLGISLLASLFLYLPLKLLLVGRGLSRNLGQEYLEIEAMATTLRWMDSHPEKSVDGLAGLWKICFSPQKMRWIQHEATQPMISKSGSQLIIPVSPLLSFVHSAGQGAESARKAFVLEGAQRGARRFGRLDLQRVECITEQMKRMRRFDLAMTQGRQYERERLAQDLHDDLGARMMVMYHQAPNEEFRQYVRDTLDDMRQLARCMSEDDLPLEDHAIDWRVDMGEYARRTHVEIEFDWEITDQRHLGLDARTQFPRILKELITNAIRHGDGSPIYTRLRLVDDTLHLVVRNQGSTPQLDQLAEGTGMRSIKRRVKEAQGSVVWQAGTPSGVEVQVQFPLRHPIDSYPAVP